MKSREEILQRIENHRKDITNNNDSIKYFENKNNYERVDFYTRVNTKIRDIIDELEWALD